MSIFAHIRYSSENQTGNTSIEMQRDAIRQFVEATDENNVPRVNLSDGLVQRLSRPRLSNCP